MTTYTNRFTWSKSRDDSFRKCPRMYYFQYYGSWGGWSEDADERTKKIYVLKQLQTRQMWAGKKVHECIKNVIEKIRHNTKTISAQESIEQTLALMRKEFLNSKKEGYWTEPKSCGFFEHEYKLPVPDSEWKNTADHVVTCLNTFFNSNIYRTILQLPREQWLEVEKLSSFPYSGIEVFVMLDFAFREDQEIVIYDWKTGKEEPGNHKIQLACYGLYAVKQWSVKPQQVKTVEFYLASSNQREHYLEEKELHSFRQYLEESVKNMKDLLDDEAANTASEERFAFVNNEKFCQYCNYYKICPRWTH
ncbi:MAG: PD-(D/E)XK nuclease family protein [Candidatus Aminicenantes bacterium]|nr:PD-(D/E)XK nuclease family protein [Candidatus Aminicenantes bacterium]